MENAFVLGIGVLGGLYCIFCSIKNYDWFIESRKARVFLKLFGRTGARIFYVILGIVIIIAAFEVYFNWWI